MKTAIVTDSSTYLPMKEIKKHNIKVIPIQIIFSDESFEEGVNLTNKQFYEKLEASTTLPSTSQPPIGELINLYNRLAEEGYDNVISIHLAATISGLYQQVVQISNMVSDIRVIPFDSQITVALMGELVRYAATLAERNIDPDTIIAKLTNLRSTIDELFVVDDLKNLVKGGRLSNSSAFIGGLLNIKPLLTFDKTSDQIIAFDKVRTMKRANKRVLELFQAKIEHCDYPLKAFIMDANDPKANKEWVKNFKRIAPNQTVVQSYLGPTIGTHLGERAMALGWMQDIDQIHD
ncbi:DegV family protein [Fructilactobacillus florum]|uniref:DegV family protein n=1 Tax=Fructilactobacillus florum DSM 22689 = JCM 16035 TaxID=1423745 RepID=A0A0R2CJE9_9LACO|nr:DegV family protein [Fructilactobacillus florum]KRM91736.1 hypothetical protein FC87_GL000560 [Fructilactobacillus florum DSM 22689 = JCM 16035]